MDNGLLHIGHGNYVSKNKILAITTCESSPMRRKRLAAEDGERFIDCTAGKKTRSFLHLTDGFIVSTSTRPEALSERTK